jgi:putative ABC transport system substrate-binding protein
MMHRRRLVSVLAAVAAASLASGQAPAGAHRIGYLGYTAVNTADDERLLAAFRQGLREKGLVEGGNLVIEWRYAEGRLERESEMATELVAAGVELVIVASGSAARAVMKASAVVPVVAIAVPDPVRAGLVASLLKAAVPAATRIAMARCPRCLLSAGTDADGVKALYAAYADAARAQGVTLVALDVNDRHDFEAAGARLQRERPGALLLNATQVNGALRAEWAALATTLRLPTMAPVRGYGAMLSYGPDYAAVFRRAADYVARILEGASPGELPMEQPTRFEFIVDRRVARAIGARLPQDVLLRADEVIE